MGFGRRGQAAVYFIGRNGNEAFHRTGADGFKQRERSAQVCIKYKCMRVDPTVYQRLNGIVDHRSIEDREQVFVGDSMVHDHIVYIVFWGMEILVQEIR